MSEPTAGERAASLSEDACAHYPLSTQNDCLATALRAERAAVFEEAARIAESIYPHGGVHTYASENADRYVALEDAAQVIAAALRARGEAEG